MNASAKMRFLNAAVLVTGLAALSIPAAAAGERNYQAIVDRNPFGLKPPPPPPVLPDPTANKPPPVSNINMTGITADLDSKKVWLMANINGKQPPQVYYSMAEGDKQDDIEVVSIDEVSETVKILNGGVPLTLTFATHGRKGGGPASMAGVPAPAGVPGANPPGTIAGSQPPSAAGAGGPVVVGRKGVLMNNGAQPSSASTFVTQPPGVPGAPGGTSGDTSYSGGARVIPSRSLRTQTGGAPPSTEPPLPAEAQYLLMNAQKIEASKRGIALPPLPPIPGAPNP